MKKYKENQDMYIRNQDHYNKDKLMMSNILKIQK